MRAMAFERFGGTEVLGLRDVPEPEPAPGEVKVRVRAVAVNRNTDIALHERPPAFPIPMPHIPGIDSAGWIVAVGAGVSESRLGEDVVTVANLWCGECEMCRRRLENACLRGRMTGIHTQGGYAEFVCVPSANALPLPAGMDHVQAAAAVSMLPVAWHLLADRGGLRAGETVLVLAAGGSLGSSGVQVARRLEARVIAAVGAAWKLERVRALGADEVVDYSREELSDRVLELTDGRGVDVVFENVSSAELWPQSLRSLAVRGRLVTGGAHGGGLVGLDVPSFYRRHLAILSAAGAPLEQVRHALGLGLRVPVHAVLPLERAAEAQELVRGRGVFGRVLLTVA